MRETVTPEWIFTIEVRVPERGDGEGFARSAVAEHLEGLVWDEKASRIVIPGEWRDLPQHKGIDTSLKPGERYELTPVKNLAPGDQIYLMAQRRTVLAKPWHPDEMRPELLRIPMSDQGPGMTKIGPPFERDFLVPRLVE